MTNGGFHQPFQVIERPVEPPHVADRGVTTVRLSFFQRLQPECRSRLLAAADARFVDGDALYQAGRRGGAIYLWGYCAEISLKVAFFRHAGFALSQPITPKLMWQDLTLLASRSMGAFVKPDNLHDVVAWSQALICLRQVLGRPMSVRLASQLSASCRRITDGWSETIRYHGNRAWPNEATAFRKDVLWIKRRTRIL